MRATCGLVLGLVLLGVNGCGGRAAGEPDGGPAGGDGQLPLDAGPGTPCQSDCDCSEGLACLGTQCTVADRNNQCCYNPFCPAGASCELPGGRTDTCPTAGSCSGLGEQECGAQGHCVFCPGCDGVPDACVDGDLLSCDARCPPPPIDCHALDEVTCGTFQRCQVATCPGCNGEQFVGCLDADEPLPPCEPPPCPPPPVCDGLDPDTCAASPGCTPVYCPDCSGFSTYAGCNGGPGPQVGCVGAPCPDGCRSQADCAGPGERCLAPGKSPGCGACFNTELPCNVDADCGQSGIICTTVECACSGGTYCQVGCMGDAACAEDEFCSPDDFRCHPVACFGAGGGLDCPIDHTCTEVGCGPGAIPCCQRQGCNVDSDCPPEKNAPPGYCVNGLCYRSPGQCVPPPP